MRRVHIIGLPRSGTSSMVAAIGDQLELPTAVEPLFLWTDGFRIDLVKETLPEAAECQRVRNGIKIFDRVFGSSGGFVEKTPSSVFLAPALRHVLRDSVVVVVSRDKNAIVESLVGKVLLHKDGNVSSWSNLHVHKLLTRFNKILFMSRCIGVSRTISSLGRFREWESHNGILGLRNREEIERYVDLAVSRLEMLDVGEANAVVRVNYEDFRANNNMVLEQVCAALEKLQVERGGAR